ncbi:MAG: PQQ-binding-like beta-propeller repeat protein [Gammaproteobacteria bacterium]|nr:PQQ-binding-like beta-propeller repeat protein [Gammaproteobacteria bacterium]MDD9895090.1 PQQ-binding-like beta-propeller repeat protein [Gammaproteobacteria bacterium]MDD9958013.1 PQQ-binding-like beta-propeller repeat protein [Gammaproteobacteria bacterium]
MSDSNRFIQFFSILLLIIAAPLVLGGLQLLFLGGSFYYLIAGVALAYSGWRLWAADAQGSLVYGFLFFFTIAWSFMESGTNLWALAPRILPWAVLGIPFLSPWVRNNLYAGNPPPLFASSIAKAAVPLSVVIIIFVFVEGTGYEVREMSPRSGINTVNSETDWPSYGNSLKGTRYSPLAQINADNVGGLELAWTYRTGAGGAFKATPLMVGELLYMCTGGNRVVALNAESGELAWQFDPLIDSAHLNQARYFTTGCRGVSYYQAPPEYNGECQARILTNTTDARLIAVDALSGERCSLFGDQGEVNLTIGMGNDPRIANFQTSPPGIVRGNAVVGGWVIDNRSVGPPSGVVRAFNAITGEFAWAWDMGRPGMTTEPLRGEVYTRGTPNVWSLFSVDEELGLIYAPTGNETPDYFGGLRMEVSDEYASSVVAIDGATGNVRWSYQTVHHDIWDYDVPSQPTLIDLPGNNGEKVKAVIQPTKRGEIFILNRETGEPLFDIQELPVPQTGGVPEDYVAATQPFTMDLPIWRMQLDETRMWGITPLDQMWCRIEYRKMRYEGHFTVPGVGTILQNPGATGGFNWGSISVDEANNLMIVNPLYMANQLTLTPRDQLPEGVVGSQLGTPYSHNTQRFMSPLHVPCMQPPYGTLGVVDLETKELLWQRPIGTAKATGPLNIPTRLPITIGTPQTGGTVTTAGGLIFSAGAFDNTVRATDLMNGEELWNHAIPYTAQGTPMTYLSPEGKQTLIVVVPVFNSTRGSGYEPLSAEEEDPLGGYVFAFRLPD